MVRVDPGTARQLAERIPDQPLTFGARCMLLRELAAAWILGSPEQFEAVVLQPPWSPTELTALTSDVEALWGLLREVPGWDCVYVLPTEHSAELGKVLERELRSPVRLHPTVTLVLDQDAIPHFHPSVRPLTGDDADLVETAPSVLRPLGFSSTIASLTGGVVAGGIIDDRLVASVAMTLSSEEFADIQAHTLEPWRNRGLATAAAYLVVRELQARGFRPVWSAGEDNLPSQRVAQKVGFREFARGVYVVVPSLQRAGGFRPTVPSSA